MRRTSSGNGGPEGREGSSTRVIKAQSAESLFAALKNEMYYRRSWPTRARARFAVAEYIEVF